jgi:hypothetical protein
MAIPHPDDPCFTVLPSGAICGHRYGRHFEALLATLARVCEGYEKQGKLAVAKRIRAIYAEELPKANADYDMPAAPVMAEVIEQVADALERVRRAKCVDGDVRDALDAVRA